MIRKLILIIMVLSTLMCWQSPVTAKGSVDRIVITSPALIREIIIEDDGLITLLSMSALEDLRFEAINEPADIDVGYELERQFAWGKDFTTLDYVMYYPSTRSQQGYVHSRYPQPGKEDDWSDYKWYYIRPEAELALNHVLNSQHLNNYLIAYGGEGSILLLDPHSLDSQFTLDTQQEEWSYVTDSGASLDGTRLFFQTTSSETQQQNLLDLTSMEACSIGVSAFVVPTLDGNHLLFEVGNTLHVRDAKTYELVETITLDADNNIYLFPDDTVLEGFGAVWNSDEQQLEFIRVEALRFNVPDNRETSELQRAGVAIQAIGSYQGRLYFYPRMGRYQIWDTSKVDEIDGGIFLTTHDPETLYERFQPDIKFQQVIMAGNALFALETPFESDVSTIYRLNINTGEILNSLDVSPDVHFLSYEALDTRSLTDSDIVLGECDITLP